MITAYYGKRLVEVSPHPFMAGKRKLVTVTLVEGAPFDVYTHGGWCETDHAVVSYDCLTGITDDEDCPCCMDETP